MSEQTPPPGAARRKYTLSLDDRGEEVEVWQEGEEYVVRSRDRIDRVSLAEISQGHLFSLLINGDSFEVFADRDGSAFDLLVGAESYLIDVQRGHRPPGAARRSEKAGVWVLKSPMTGIVVEVVAQPGETVAPGAVLLVLESMKMNNELRAQRGGVVQSVHVAPGQRVERNTLLLELRPE